MAKQSFGGGSSQGNSKKRKRDAAREAAEEELPAEKTARRQGQWLANDRKQTKLPSIGGGGPASTPRPAQVNDDIGLEKPKAAVGKKKAKLIAKVEMKKARSEARKAAAANKENAKAKEALKQGGPGVMHQSAKDLLAKTARTPQGEQRMLALIAEKIAGNPQSELKVYFDLFFEIHNNGASKRTRDLALLSAIAVFKDLVPGYRIRTATDKEKEVQRSREVIQLETYEMAVLQAYKRLLPALEAALKWDGPTFANALGALVRTAHDFNFRNRLLSTAVKHCNGKDEGIRKVLSEALSDMVESDGRLEASTEFVVAVGNIAQATAAGKGQQGGLKVELLQVFLKLPVGKAEFAALQEEASLKAIDEETAKGLAESRIHQSAKALQSAEAKLLYEVFVVYLRILRQRHLHSRRLVATILIGLTRWGQQVNLELLLEIIQELRHTVLDALGQSDDVVSLQGINCALVLLSGPSQALITDATWLPNAVTQAFGLSLSSLWSAHSEVPTWPPERCFTLASDGSLGYRQKELTSSLEADSVPSLLLSVLENAVKCPHAFGRASDGAMAALLESVFLLATSSDPHVSSALLREAAQLLKRHRKLHTILDADGGLFGLGGITDRAISIAWPLHLLGSSLVPMPNKIGRKLPDSIRSRLALVSELFPFRSSKTWLEREFPVHLAALAEVPKPAGVKEAHQQKSKAPKTTVSFCASPEELARRLGSSR
mmetsp:Transcript_95830/g.200302  ORF Transcript_95830/g.200302 Transcript_95830/m.200302 type:complete len:719 (-) Transcript_95830:32-2188(-)|eukprot:CAMPEP_0206436926 /NCGR_PEP_ID=MMETSP0324_2-20121206/10757_1 /ASSEMBLY_ACC=CAM_ASM_000836 /TAXON_ID=2866 /ORGANISM="Crypthecodinium cohnii, Strain Seligo" /LENGTH=718 /DNA_ID=CAMNT_0053904151 /DNA_START=190 /DNA_END=2346 /DNA_ORIENTATION=-